MHVHGIVRKHIHEVYNCNWFAVNTLHGFVVTTMCKPTEAQVVYESDTNHEWVCCSVV